MSTNDKKPDRFITEPLLDDVDGIPQRSCSLRSLSSVERGHSFLPEMQREKKKIKYYIIMWLIMLIRLSGVQFGL